MTTKLLDFGKNYQKKNCYRIFEFFVSICLFLNQLLCVFTEYKQFFFIFRLKTLYSNNKTTLIEINIVVLGKRRKVEILTRILTYLIICVQPKLTPCRSSGMEFRKTGLPIGFSLSMK